MSEKIRVIQISETEYIVGQNITQLVDDDIIQVMAEGPQNDETAIAQAAINRVLIDKAGGKVNYVIDLNKVGKSSPAARKIWKDLSEDKGTVKTALIGFHPVARVMASFVMSITNARNVKFFGSLEEGLKWIKGE